MAANSRKRFHKFTASDEQDAMLRAEARRRGIPEHKVFREIVDLGFAEYFDGRSDEGEGIGMACRLADSAADDARRARDAAFSALAATVWSADVVLALMRTAFTELGVVREGASYARPAARALNETRYGSLMELWRLVGELCSEGVAFEYAMGSACERIGVDADPMLGVMQAEEDDDDGFGEWFADLANH